MYNGYRVKINGNTISNDFISQGSYSAHRKQRVLYEFYDAYGVKHEVLSRHKPMEISFSIRERNMKEQQYLSGILAQCENIEVMYWDDVSCEYKTGRFKMESPVFKHRNTRDGSINYNKTKITLIEY